MAGASSLVHATAIAVDGRAALLLGASGVGKSDLALRCLMLDARDGERTLRAALVADDQVLLEVAGGRLMCRAPAAIAGLMEVRGLGILSMPRVPEAEVALAVRLVPGPVERLPEPSAVTDLLGHSVSELHLDPFEASSAVKVLLALARGLSAFGSGGR